MGQISFTDLVNGVIPDASDFNDRFNALKNRINNGLEADNIANSAISKAKIQNNAVDASKIDETDDYVWTGDHDFTGATVTGAYVPTADNALTGSVVQTATYQTGAVATGVTVLPYDDTIPQNNEGDEFMSLAVTPLSATNKLKITVVINFAHSSGGPSPSFALFQDTTANALAAMRQHPAGTSTMQSATLIHVMTAGTTSATTFRVRAGHANPTDGTFTFNGSAGNRKFGGVLASSITIEEIKV
jgi:hypothetical protein